MNEKIVVLSEVISNKATTKADLKIAAEGALKLLTATILDDDGDGDQGWDIPPEYEACTLDDGFPPRDKCIEILKAVWKKERSNVLRQNSREYPALIKRT